MRIVMSYFSTRPLMVTFGVHALASKGSKSSSTKGTRLQQPSEYLLQTDSPLRASNFFCWFSPHIYRALPHDEPSSSIHGGWRAILFVLVNFTSGASRSSKHLPLSASEHRGNPPVLHCPDNLLLPTVSACFLVLEDQVSFRWDGSLQTKRLR